MVNESNQLSRMAEILRAIGEPSRIGILKRLRRREHFVTELVKELGSNQANISRHLSTLYLTGIVSRHKCGNRVHYAIAVQEVFDIIDCIESVVNRSSRKSMIAGNRISP